MREFRRWHLPLAPLPVIGWLLLLAYLLDEHVSARGVPGREPLAGAGARASFSRASRLGAGCIDLGLVFAAWLLLPPAAGWLLGCGYLLFRDAGERPLSVGKRVLGIRAHSGNAAGLSYTTSFARNLPLLVPYLGFLVEGGLILSGRRRLGDHLAHTAICVSR